MKLDRTPITVLLLLAAVAAVQAVHYYPLLPDRIAVHFGAGGVPNGWSGKAEFMLTYAVVEALVVGLGLLLALLIDRIPAGLINIPHREYWMAPERRARTSEYLVNQTLWIEIVTLLFLIAIAQLVYVGNVGSRPPRLSSDFWYIFTAFVVATVWLSLRILLRFRRKGPEGPTET